MKKSLVRFSIIAALATTASFAETYYAEVPFDFVLANKTMHAGQYIVKPTAGSTIITIQSADWKESAMVMGNKLSAPAHPGEGKLVFHRYGNRYFLSEIWSRGTEGGQVLPAGSQEKELIAGKAQRFDKAVALR